jgi:hypothetical protein
MLEAVLKSSTNVNFPFYAKKNRNKKNSSLMYLQWKNKNSSFPSPGFPFPNLSAIKYVDFSVYILACVPYLVGKQNSEYVKRSVAKKDFAF